MPVIRVDDDVMQRLQLLAVEMRLVFGSPNDVLRKVLLETNTNGTLVSHPIPTNTERTKTRRRRTASGSVLLREHVSDGSIDANVKLGYYHLRGRTYSKSFLESNVFPVVFFDTDGFVVLNSAQDVENNAAIDVGMNVSVLNNIVNLPGYIRCNHTHSR